MAVIDQVVLEGNHAISNCLVGGPGGRAVFQGNKLIEEWTRAIVARGASALSWTLGLAPTNLPLRAIHGANGRLVFLVEYPPALRTMSWIRENSPKRWGLGTTYRRVTIALPYVLFFIALHDGRALANSSVYFRKEPVQCADYGDELLDCHFLNCSVRASGVYCWICSQYMASTSVKGQSPLEFVAATIDNFWFAASNLSSEDHEGQSFFGKGSAGRHAIRDPRVRTIAAWEKASAEDPNFVLQVPWNSAGRTIRDVFRELSGGDPPWPFRTATDLGNLVLTKKRKE